MREGSTQDFPSFCFSHRDSSRVSAHGEITESEKSDFLGAASALVFPISWPEPFGLVMIEAMACGTPVIGFRQGSVPEVIKHGRTGFIVETVEEAASAISQIGTIDRATVRATFERRFSIDVMGKNYERTYADICGMRENVVPLRRKANGSAALPDSEASAFTSLDRAG